MAFFASDTRPTVNRNLAEPRKSSPSPNTISIPINKSGYGSNNMNGNINNGNSGVAVAPIIPLPAKECEDSAANIRPSGQALYIGSPRYPNTFRLNVGDGVDVTQIGCAISGQGQPEMWTNNKGGGLIEVSYRVGLVGKYKIFITYKGEHIEGSPFTLTMR